MQKNQMLLPPEFQDKKPSPQFVEIPERLTHFQFGCSKELFEAEVKGKLLKVVKRFGDYVTVEVGPKKEWFNVHNSDLLTCKKDGQA